MSKKDIFKIFRQHLVNLMASNPKLATFGIGLIITMAVGVAIGLVDYQQVLSHGPICNHLPCPGYDGGDSYSRLS